MTQPKASGDSVRAYLRDIGRVPLLEHDEEILLGRQVQRLMELEEMKTEMELDNEGLAEAMELPVKQIKRELREGKKAKEKMVTANLRLVVSVAKNIPSVIWNFWTSSRKVRSGSFAVSRSLILVVVISFLLTLIGGYAKGSPVRSLKNRGRSVYQFTLQRTSTGLRKPSVN